MSTILTYFLVAVTSLEVLYSKAFPGDPRASFR